MFSLMTPIPLLEEVILAINSTYGLISSIHLTLYGVNMLVIYGIKPLLWGFIPYLEMSQNKRITKDL